jgi:hypothetical protein
VVLEQSGDEWCDGCHSDADDGTDRDPSLYVKERKPDGRCACCGAEVVAGERVDEDPAGVVGFPS